MNATESSTCKAWLSSQIMRALRAAFLLGTVSGLAACAVSAPEKGAAEAVLEKYTTDTGEAESALHYKICMIDYYSDATRTNLVGQWGGYCGTNVFSWGVTTGYRIHTCEDCRPEPPGGP
ncbi:DUF6289 family protein [Sorangium sp. So ce429]